MITAANPNLDPKEKSQVQALYDVIVQYLQGLDLYNTALSSIGSMYPASNN